MNSARTYRRRIWYRATGPGAASIDVEDDQHRFGVDLTHDGRHVTTIAGRALRTPWSICPGATAALAALAGSPLLRSPYAVLRQVRLGDHCTHLIDMAAIGVAAAARGVRERAYDLAITAPVDEGVDIRDARMMRDGGKATRWRVQDGIFVEPSRYAGLELRRAASWSAERAADDDAIEAILVFQRAAFVASTVRRTIAETDSLRRATDSRVPPGACWAMQAERVGHALRNVGSKFDLTDTPDRLLSDLTGLDAPI